MTYSFQGKELIIRQQLFGTLHTDRLSCFTFTHPPFLWRYLLRRWATRWPLFPWYTAWPWLSYRRRTGPDPNSTGCWSRRWNRSRSGTPATDRRAHSWLKITGKPRGCGWKKTGKCEWIDFFTKIKHIWIFALSAFHIYFKLLNVSC